MSKIYFLLFILFFNFPSKLLSQVNISGQITDKSNKSIEFIEVQLQNKDSIIVKSELTNIDGKFTIVSEKGQYQLLIKQLGKILQRQKVNADQDTYVGVIQVSENQQQLKEVVVNSKKKLIERKVDRLIFNVENSVSASGGDAIDALKITPNIKVKNDEISMIGKSSMGVMIDDKIMKLSGEDLINFLKTISTDNIKSIEVITNPPAKYEAEGNSGLINIKLKKAKKDSWSATLNSAFKQSTYSTGNIGGSFNYQKNKISLIANTNYSNGSIQGIENSKIFYPTQMWKSENKEKYYSNLLSSRLGFDYQITKKWSAGIQYIGSYSKPNIDDSNNTFLTDNITNNNNGIIQTFGNSIRKRNLNSINWHTNIALDTLGKNISFDFDYLNYKSNTNRNFISNTTNSIQTEIPNGFISANNLTNQKIDNYSAQINIEYPLKWTNLNYGSKLSYSKTDNHIDFLNTTTGLPIYDSTQSDFFSYKENTQSLFITANKKMLKNKLEIQFGLRLENTQTEGNSITLNQTTKNNLNKIFPTTYLSYTPNENNVFSINYGKRIYRPNFNELNPFKWYSNQYSYSEGNPYLKPTYTHNLEFSYSYKDYLYTTAVYSKDLDNSGQVVLFNVGDYQQKTTRLNYFDDYSFGIQQVYMFKKYQWLESQNAIYVYYQHSDSKIFPITPKSNQGYGATITSSNTFTLNKAKNILTELEFQHNFPHQSSDLVYNYATTQLNLSLKMLFLQKKLQFTLTANNLFKAYDFNNISNRNNVETINNGYYDTKYVRFSLSYKFGNSKVNVDERQIGNEDEKNRSN